MADWAPPLNLWHPSLKEASEKAHKLVSEAFAGISGNPMAGRWLTLTGAAGCGKSALAGYTLDYFKRISPHNGPRVFSQGAYNVSSGPPRRPQCGWISETKFAERMRENREYDLPEYLADDWVVVFDDLGAARDKSQFIADALFRLCNARLGKWTIFTTNLTLGEVAERIDERVASRLIRDDNVVHAITSGDYALRGR